MKYAKVFRSPNRGLDDLRLETGKSQSTCKWLKLIAAGGRIWSPGDSEKHFRTWLLWKFGFFLIFFDSFLCTN